MIKTEYPYSNNPDWIRTYSDNGKMIKQVETGVVYDEAIDKYPCRYTYEETAEDVEVFDNDIKDEI